MLTPAIVLAAGASSRCPDYKLLRLYRGRPLLAWTLENLLAHPGVGPILVVTGHCREQLEHIIPESITAVFNPHWQSGLASSLRAGIQAVPNSSPGTLVTLGDTPFFSPETLRELLVEREAEEIRVPQFGGKVGHPKYFPRWLFPELCLLKGDEGAKSLIKKNQNRCRVIAVDDPGVLFDFDSEDDFDRPHPRSD